jgi:hypothetical protein
MPKGFVGPAASYLECRARGNGVEVGAPTVKPTVANAVYSPAPLSATATAELCAPGALGEAAGGATPAALLVAFEGSACLGVPRGAPVRLDGTCRPAPPGAPKPFRRDTLLCVAGANATVRGRKTRMRIHSMFRCAFAARAECSHRAQAEACDDAACAQGCQPVAPVATAANACRDGVLALCAALAPKAAHR